MAAFMLCVCTGVTASGVHSHVSVYCLLFPMANELGPRTPIQLLREPRLRKSEGFMQASVAGKWLCCHDSQLLSAEMMGPCRSSHEFLLLKPTVEDLPGQASSHIYRAQHSLRNKLNKHLEIKRFHIKKGLQFLLKTQNIWSLG